MHHLSRGAAYKLPLSRPVAGATFHEALAVAERALELPLAASSVAEGALERARARSLACGTNGGGHDASRKHYGQRSNDQFPPRHDSPLHETTSTRVTNRPSDVSLVPASDRCQSGSCRKLPDEREGFPMASLDGI